MCVRAAVHFQLAVALVVAADPKAISPQAPVTDWYLGDDFHHNGALFLQDAFGFMHEYPKVSRFVGVAAWLA